jgi:ketosteroid isomerase-like protein
MTAPMAGGAPLDGAGAVSDVIASLRIQRTLAAYCQLCDDGEFRRLAEQFAPDGSFVFAGEAVTGRAALERWFEAAQPPRRRGKHLTANAIIDVEGDHASVVSDFLFVRVLDGVPALQIAGRYRDIFVRIGDGWLIERRDVKTMDDQAGDSRKGTEHGHG